MDAKKNVAPALEMRERQGEATLSEEQSRKLKYLNLAKQFHLPLSAAIENYDTLSQQGT